MNRYRLPIAALFATFAIHAAPASRTLDQAVSGFVRDSGFSGVVLVADEGRPVYRKAFGLASREWSIPATPTTRFRIASVTKTFTAVLAMQAVQAGKIALDGAVATYLSEYADQPFAKVTIDELLTYASGLPATDQTSGMTPYEQALTPSAFIARYAGAALVDEPGRKFAYKNLDYILLSRVLEAVEGRSFATLLQERIIAPLGLTDTLLLDADAIVPRLATGYFVDDEQPGEVPPTLHHDLPYHPETYGAAGAMVSTADDLLKFDDALRKGVLLDAASTERMLKAHESLGYVAYGFWVYPCKAAGAATRCAERQGSILGSNALWLRDLDHGRSFIVLANSNLADLQKLKGLLLESH